MPSMRQILRGQQSVTNNCEERILTGADISVPVSVFVSGMFGHFTWKVTSFMPDILEQKKSRYLNLPAVCKKTLQFNVSVSLWGEEYLFYFIF